jgi:membrane-bound lytic murein transglycosylase A
MWTSTLHADLAVSHKFGKLQRMNIRLLVVLFLMPLMILSFEGCRWRRKKKVEEKDYFHQLGAGEVGLVEVDSAQLPDLRLTPENRSAVRKAIANSLDYFSKASSTKGYPVAGIEQPKVIASLKALDELLASAKSDSELNAAIKSQFRVFMSVGCDNEGTVLFTGYCTPIYNASVNRDETYRYPLYKKPANLVPGDGDAIAKIQSTDGSMKNYPERREIESSNMLAGQELVWLTDPFEAYIVQVQGSGKLRLPSGEFMEVGYDGSNNYPYHSIAKDLIDEGKISPRELSLSTLRSYFKQHPDELGKYLPRNPRYIFFAQSKRGIVGSLNVPVTADVSVATDKSLFPRGAPAVVSTTLGNTSEQAPTYSALRVDQDAGGAIRAPGRCDLYMGVGDEAERRAGSQFAEGKLYYLIAK